MKRQEIKQGIGKKTFSLRHMRHPQSSLPTAIFGNAPYGEAKRPLQVEGPCSRVAAEKKVAYGVTKEIINNK